MQACSARAPRFKRGAERAKRVAGAREAREVRERALYTRALSKRTPSAYAAGAREARDLFASR